MLLEKNLLNKWEKVIQNNGEYFIDWCEFIVIHE